MRGYIDKVLVTAIEFPVVDTPRSLAITGRGDLCLVRLATRRNYIVGKNAVSSGLHGNASMRRREPARGSVRVVEAGNKALRHPSRQVVASLLHSAFFAQSID